MHPEFQTHPITTYFIKVHPDSSNCRLFPQFTQVQPNAHAHLESTDKREHKKMRRGDWQGKRHLLRMCTMLRTLAIKKNIPHISIWYGKRENCVLKIKAQLNCRRCLLSVHNIFGLVSKYLFHVVKSLGYQHFESACLILSFGFFRSSS